ncbi:MAG: YgiQ family radical SAM protein [Bacteroidales bacterium]|nr:YgiQ family radical SAM protein [Bacteroidales bacterium]
MPELKAWLPLTKKEMLSRGWDELDVILITGDAYVDHPSFGIAIIGRLIEEAGYRVGIISQPNWQDDLRDFKRYGKPRFFFGISSGSMDSMVNHYTAAKRLRSTDAYTAGGKSGFRPDYATSTYARIVRQLYPDSLIILGGIEASLRRLTHYDYWSDQLLPSILYQSKADIIAYGMGEKNMMDILDVCAHKEHPAIQDFCHIPQIVYAAKKENLPENKDSIYLHSYQTCKKSKEAFAHNFKLIETESNKKHPKTLIEPYEDGYTVVNPPYSTMTQAELDHVYALPYTRLPHPKYNKRGEISAFIMIQNSINIHRGCFGGCSFCTISAHQGKFISGRSSHSILQEIKCLTQMPYFKGHISDLGGPSANMYLMHGMNDNLCQSCERASCIFPDKCKNLNYNHQPLLDLYRQAQSIKGVQRITIGSGIRYDLLLCDDPALNKAYHIDEYTETLIRKHVSGRLKIAPEHTENHVLKLMRKPDYEKFLIFRNKFLKINNKYQLRQQLIPYFISSHPACTMQDMIALKKKMKQICYHPEQVQDFTPTPMTLSSTIFYTGINPYTGQKVFCETNLKKKQQQKNCFFNPSQQQ